MAGYRQPMSSYGHLPAEDVAAIMAYLHRYSPPPTGVNDPLTPAEAAAPVAADP